MKHKTLFTLKKEIFFKIKNFKREHTKPSQKSKKKSMQWMKNQ